MTPFHRVVRALREEHENAKSSRRVEQERRLAKANALIECIASHGRKFFSHEGRVARLELDARGRVWFVDAYNDARIYTHHAGPWRRFTGGGTLRDLVKALRDYVKRGDKIRHGFGPWPDWYCGGDLWGYGEDMAAVRLVATELGILEVEPPKRAEARTA